MAERKVSFKAGKGGQTVTPKKGEILVIEYTGDEPTEQYTDKDFSFGQVGKDVVIQRNRTKDYMVIKNMTLNEATNVTFKAVYKDESKEPVDIKTWTCDFTNDWYPVTLHINSKGNQGFKFVGTNLNEKVTATSKNDTLKLNGGKQNIVFAGEGNDKIYGSKGNDYFFYGVDDALAFGEDGLTEDIVNEYDSSKKGKLIISAEELGKVVKDEMVEYYYYKFGTKQNTIEIPYYASQVDGSDTKYYIGYHGDGSDKIYNATKNDNIVLRANSNESDLTYSRDANNLIIHVDDGKDTPTKITLMDYFNKTNRLKNIYFGDLFVPKTKTEGVTPEDKDEVTVRDPDFTISTGSVDNINFYGSKKLVGSEYNETFIGSKKADKIYTKAGTDTVIAGAGNDTIRLDGEGDKTIVYKGWDYSKYGENDENLAPLINEGNDTIYIDNSVYSVDIRFDGYLGASDTYKASLNGKDLILSMTDENDEQRGTVTIKDYFVNSNISDKFFIDGANPDLNDIYITGNSKKKNTIYDTTYDDVIKGGKKVDKIYLSSGNDIVNAGKGNDKIYINGKGTKTIIMDKSSGSDSISINNSIAVADIQFGNNDISPDSIIYTSNGSNLTITGHYDAIQNARGKITTKAVNDKVTINNFNVKLNGNALNLSDEKINITGSYNKKKKTYTYTGTEYDDVIKGSTKKDIIHAGNGNNIINVGKKGNSIITAGSGDDTYNIQNLNANIDIEDEDGNNDTINLKNTKLSDINLFFNVNKDDYIYNSDKDLTIYNNKNASLVMASKNPKGLIDIDNYFKEDSSVGGTGYIENFMVGDVNISTELKSVISSIASEVKDFLNGITDKNYTCALDVMADKSKAGKAYLKQMMKIYTSHKLTGQTESLLGAKPMNALLSEVAAWQGNDSSVDTTLKFENSETQDIQTLVAQYSN